MADEHNFGKSDVEVSNLDFLSKATTAELTVDHSTEIQTSNKVQVDNVSEFDKERDEAPAATTSEGNLFISETNTCGDLGKAAVTCKVETLNPKGSILQDTIQQLNEEVVESPLLSSENLQRVSLDNSHVAADYDKDERVVKRFPVGDSPSSTSDDDDDQASSEEYTPSSSESSEEQLTEYEMQGQSSGMFEDSIDQASDESNIIDDSIDEAQQLKVDTITNLIDQSREQEKLQGFDNVLPEEKSSANICEVTESKPIVEEKLEAESSIEHATKENVASPEMASKTNTSFEQVEENIFQTKPNTSTMDNIDDISITKENISTEKVVPSSEEKLNTSAVNNLEDCSIIKENSTGGIVSAKTENILPEKGDISLTAKNLSTLKVDVPTKEEDASPIEKESKTDDKPVEVLEEWMQILGTDLLKKKIIKKGLGVKPCNRELVTLDYECCFENGTVCEKKEDLAFVLGDGEVCQAIELATKLMEVEEVCELVSDVKYCVNELKNKLFLPTKGSVTYTIKLKSIKDGPYSPNTPVDKKVEWVEKKKKQGNSLYSTKKFKLSLRAYGNCITVLKEALKGEISDEIKLKHVKDLTVKCYNNVAASHLMLLNWKLAVSACIDAEAIDPDNVKTLLRKGKGLNKLGRIEEALSVFKRACKLNPNATDVQVEMEKLNKKISEQKEAQKKMCQRMFGTTKDKKEVQREKQGKSSAFSWGAPLVLGSSAVILAAVVIGFYWYQK